MTNHRSALIDSTRYLFRQFGRQPCHDEAVAAAGKDAAAGRLVGEVMNRSACQADAKAVQAGLRRRLRS